MIVFNCKRCSHQKVCGKKVNLEKLKESQLSEMLEQFDIVCCDIDTTEADFYDEMCKQAEMELIAKQDYEEEIYIRERDCGMR